MDKVRIEQALSSWRELNKTIATLTKEEAEYALITEELNNNRTTVKDRLQQRLRAIEVEETREKWR